MVFCATVCKPPTNRGCQRERRSSECIVGDRDNSLGRECNVRAVTSHSGHGPPDDCPCGGKHSGMVRVKLWDALFGRPTILGSSVAHNSQAGPGLGQYECMTLPLILTHANQQ